MIIVKLMGGLGNQMFQYAAARRMALVNDLPLKLDLNWFRNLATGATPRQYDLHVFDIEQAVALPREVKELQGVDIGRWPKIMKRYLRSTLVKKTWVKEKHFHFDPEIFQLNGNAYLDGYWQSSRYFADAEEIIRKKFTITSSPDPANARMAEMIQGTEAVSVHVRRGDYLLSPLDKQVYATCGLDYYASCVEIIARQVTDLHLFVFTDDPTWARQNLSFPFPTTFVTHNGPEKAYEDLRLMSLCRHHIIANSSFSWWGAWLGGNPGKIVIAPKKWFNQPDMDTSDLIPERWVQI